MPNFKLSPSDFAFLWDECKRCFYLKVAGGFPRPSQPFPKIFGIIDTCMKNWYEKKRSEDMAEGVPPGVVEFGDGWVESEPLTLPGHASSCYIRGIFDSVIKLDDGGYAVIDFKTTEMRASSLAKYSRQLHAYALALENPSKGNMALSPVTGLGLLVYQPVKFSQANTESASLEGTLTWHGIKRDDGKFREFLGEVMTVLELPEAPKAASGCSMCKYREASRRTGL